MSTPPTFQAASAQTAALPDTLPVELSSGGTALVCRLSWLQFETLWTELAALCGALAAAPAEANHALSQQEDALLAALAAAPQFVLRLAACSARLPEHELAQWPPCDVLALAAAGLELNFIRPAGVRAFFASVTRLGG